MLNLTVNTLVSVMARCEVCDRRGPNNTFSGFRAIAPGSARIT